MGGGVDGPVDSSVTNIYSLSYGNFPKEGDPNIDPNIL